jgi:hypothetical protein
MKIYLPSNLNVEKLKHEFTSKELDQALYFMDQILRGQALKRKEKLTKNGWTPLCSKLLEEYGVRQLKHIRKTLKECGIIEDQPYEEGVCRVYRFHLTYCVEPVLLDMPSNHFWRGVERRLFAHFLKEKKTYPITKFFNSSLTIVKQDGIEWVEDHYEFLKKEDKVQAMNFLSPNLLSIDRIVHQDFFLHKDKNGRLHSNLTNLKTELRQFLRYDNEPLVGIDFVNCQPMLLSLILEPPFWNKSSVINYTNLKGLNFKDYRHWKPQIVGPILSYKNERNLSFLEVIQYLFSSSYINLNYIYYLIFSKKQISLASKDIESLNSTTRKGEFYEFILKELNDKTTRSDVKTMMYEVLFGYPISTTQRLSKKKQMFMRLFPNVQRLIDLIKQKDHCLLANMLQSMESKLMFEILAPALQEQFPETALFTIHDSFLVPVSMAEEVKEAMSVKFNAVLGFTPKLKIES